MTNHSFNQHSFHFTQHYKFTIFKHIPSKTLQLQRKIWKSFPLLNSK